VKDDGSYAGVEDGYSLVPEGQDALIYNTPTLPQRS
jgi:hypothetical protein